MKPSRSSVLFLLLVVTGAAGAACGRRPARASAPAPEAASQTEAIDSLRPSIRVSDSTNPGVPGEPLALKRPPVESPEGEVVFQEFLQWPIARENTPPEDVPRLFLTWPAELFGSVVDGAFYTFAVYDAGNRIESGDEGKRMNASRHSEIAPWFIPLTSVVGDARLASPNKRYEISLELHLADGRVVKRRVSFHALGPIPDVIHERAAVDLLGSGRLGEARTLALRDEFVNPTTRPLTIWARVRDPRVRVHTTIRARRSRLEDAAFPEMKRVRDYQEEYRSSALLRVGAFAAGLEPAFLIRDGLKGPVTFPAEPVQDGWVRFQLPEAAKLGVSWYLEQSSDRCPLPGPEPRHYAWDAYRRRCGGGRGEGSFCDDVQYRREERRTDSWSVVGTSVETGFDVEYRVSDPHVAFAEIEPEGASPYVKALSPAAPALGRAQGDAASPSLPAFSCQGLF
jgi:hypothetical protein